MGIWNPRFSRVFACGSSRVRQDFHQSSVFCWGAVMKGRRPPAAGMGRKPGVPNKITADLKEMVLGALSDVGGREYLAQQAWKNPAAFMALIGKILPTQISGNIGLTV